MSENISKFGIKQYLTASGMLAKEVDIFGDSLIKFVIVGAGGGNTIIVRGRIQGQVGWDVIGTLVGNGETTVNVSTYDFLQIQCTVFSATATVVDLSGSGFEAGEGLSEIVTPNGTLTSVLNLEFTSSDNSVAIEAIAPNQIDFKTSSAISSHISDMNDPHGSVEDAIVNGVLNIAPSQNAVFDALVGKSNTGHTHVAADITDFTAAAKTATVANSITDGITDVAPSQDAVFDVLTLKAPLASPALTGNPTAPTQSASDNSTKIATTAYADSAISAAGTPNAVPDTLVKRDGSGNFRIGNGSTTGKIESDKELILTQVGDDFGATTLRLRNRSGENGAIFEMLHPTIKVVDFIFRTSGSQRNIRYEDRSSDTFYGTPEFQIGIAASPALVVADSLVGIESDLIVQGDITLPNENANRVVVLDGINEITTSVTTITELSYVNGVTSSLQTQLDAKAPLASPALTGTPTAPTASPADNSTKIATTAYVDNATNDALAGVSWKTNIRVGTVSDINLSSAPAAVDGITLVSNDLVLVKDQSLTRDNGIYKFNGVGLAMSRATNADTVEKLEQAVCILEEGTQAATNWRQTSVNFILGTDPVNWQLFIQDVPAASETVAGKIEIATQTETNTGTDDLLAITPLKLATHLTTRIEDNITDGVTTKAPSQNAVFDALTLKAPLVSPALTGTPTAPTASANNNSTQLSTTAYVDAAISASANLLTKEYHVDKTGNDGTGNGSKEKPYLTIQAALTAAGDAANIADFKTHVLVFVASGIYDESLTIPRGRTVTLMGKGQIILGDGAGSNWASTTPRSITADFRNEDAFGSDLKPALNIITMPNVDPTSTFLAEAGCFRISGNLNITCGASSIASTVNLSSVKIDGVISATTVGLVNILLNKTYVVGTVTALTAILQRCQDCQFDSLITVDGYNSFTNCEIKAGMIVTNNFNTLPPSGIFHSTLFGTFSGPANCVKLDLTSDYYFRTNSASLGGAATKVLLATNATASITGVLSSTDWTTFNDKAPTASPTFTGVPVAPTASANNNSTQLATTAYVDSAISGSGDTTGSATISQGQTSANITGLLFNGASIRSAVIQASIARSTTTVEKDEISEIRIKYDTITATWSIAIEGLGDSGCTFDITSGGQIQYTSDTIAGVSYAGQIRFSYKTFAV